MKKRFKKLITLLMVAIILTTTLTACGYTPSDDAQDIAKQQEVTVSLIEKQPTPTDIDYSLERYNLIRRAYWVNGQRAKANALICEVEKPLGYITLVTDNGAAVASFVVDGKVSSLNSFLTPDSEVYEIGGESTDSNVSNNGTTENDWLADVDGSYGTNDNGIFFFDVQGHYWEWTGKYLYSDVPMHVENPIIHIEVNYTDNTKNQEDVANE